jgi:hypothetical protein
MGLAAVTAAALTDHSARAAMLTLAGVDVLKQPGMTGNGYGVPLGTIQVTEAGPGSTSSLSCVIEDPLATVILPVAGDEIVFWDITADAPIFGGFVSSWTVEPDSSGYGRRISIEAVGYEVILDWAIVPSLTIPSGTDFQAAIQACVAAAEGAGGLRAFASALANGSQVEPIGHVVGFGSNVTQWAVTITGQTLREAIGLVFDASMSPAGDANSYPPLLTVDFYKGLRVWLAFTWSSGSLQKPSDYVNLTVTDTIAGANVAAGLQQTTDATNIVRGVYIVGGNAAGTGLVSSGSGRPGRIVQITDTTVDSAAKLAATGARYLAGFTIGFRGNLGLSDWTPTAGVRTGSLVVLTDTVTNATGTYRVMAIDKTFNTVRQNWTVTYGQGKPSLTSLIRRLTRTILS